MPRPDDRRRNTPWSPRAPQHILSLLSEGIEVFIILREMNDQIVKHQLVIPKLGYITSLWNVMEYPEWDLCWSSEEAEEKHLSLVERTFEKKYPKCQLGWRRDIYHDDDYYNAYLACLFIEAGHKTQVISRPYRGPYASPGTAVVVKGITAGAFYTVVKGLINQDYSKLPPEWVKPYGVWDQQDPRLDIHVLRRLFPNGNFELGNWDAKHWLGPNLNKS